MLRRVAEARLPLLDAEDTRIVAFRPADGGDEHLAVIIGLWDQRLPVPIHLHAGNQVGDLLGVLGHGAGVRRAISGLVQGGGGVLLYLRQATGLSADRLSVGSDVNEPGDTDEGLYRSAAEMLRLLGIPRVRPVDAAPAIAEGLSAQGIEIG